MCNQIFLIKNEIHLTGPILYGQELATDPDCFLQEVKYTKPLQIINDKFELPELSSREMEKFKYRKMGLCHNLSGPFTDTRDKNSNYVYAIDGKFLSKEAFDNHPQRIHYLKKTQIKEQMTKSFE